MAIQLMNDNNLDISSSMDANQYYLFGGYRKHYIIKDYAQELNVSFNLLTATLLKGQASAYGRFVINEGTEAITATLLANSTQYIVIRIDLSQTAGNECSLTAVASLQQDDLSNGGVIYDIPLYKVTTSSNAATSKTDMRFSDVNNGELKGVAFKKSAGTGQLVDSSKETIVDFDDINKRIQDNTNKISSTSIVDTTQKANDAINRFGNIKKVTAGTYVIRANGGNSAQIFSSTDLGKILGVESANGGNTCLLLSNGDGNAQAAHVQGATYVGSNNNWAVGSWHAVFDRNVSGIIRVNYVAFAF